MHLGEEGEKEEGVFRGGRGEGRVDGDVAAIGKRLVSGSEASRERGRTRLGDPRRD